MARATTLILATFLALAACSVSVAEEPEENIETQISEKIKIVTAQNVIWDGPKGRKAAIDFLARHPEASAAPLLSALQQAPDARARLWVLLCMNYFADMSVFESGSGALVELLGSDSFGTKFWAIKTAARMKLAAAIEPLEGLLASEDYLLREAAAGALGEIGRKESAEHLIKLLDDPEHMVRRAAAEALGQLKASAAKTQLIESLDPEENLVVRRAAVEALEKITGTSFDIQPRDWSPAAGEREKKIKDWIRQHK